MADTNIEITAGVGTNVDTRTEATNGNHRQVIVIGDPSTNAGVAPVDATAGLKVDLGSDNDVTVAGVSTAANQTTIIGHVDGIETVLGTIDADTSNISTKIDTLVTGQQSDALTDTQLRATAVPVSVSGVSTAANQTTIIGHVDGIETLLGTIDTDTGTIAGAVSGTEMQVDVVASLPAGTNLIGRMSGSGETSTVYDGTTALTPKFVAIAASTSGNNTILAAVVGKKIRVLAIQINASAAVNFKWQSGAGGTDLTGLNYSATNGGYVLPYNPVGWFETASNTLLNLNLSAAVAVGGSITYVEV